MLKIYGNSRQDLLLVEEGPESIKVLNIDTQVILRTNGAINCMLITDPAYHHTVFDPATPFIVEVAPEFSGLPYDQVFEAYAKVINVIL